MIFAKCLSPQWQKQLPEGGTQKCRRNGRMTTSEIMTILMCSHMSHYRDFKNYYLIHVSHVYKEDFRNLLRYTRFFEVMLRDIVPMCAYFASLKGSLQKLNLLTLLANRCATTIVFQDTKSLMVLHNKVKALWVSFMVSNYTCSLTIKV